MYLLMVCKALAGVVREGSCIVKQEHAYVLTHTHAHTHARTHARTHTRTLQPHAAARIDAAVEKLSVLAPSPPVPVWRVYEWRALLAHRLRSPTYTQSALCSPLL